MSKSTFFNKENRTSFVWNFLAVVLGIVITFGGESLISHNQEKKDLDSCLNLVRSELKNNKELLQLADTVVSMQRLAAQFILRYEDDLTKAPQDSLMMYANTPLSKSEITIYTDALELLKSSGALMKIEDKGLALEIFETYGGLEDNMLMLKMFFEHKDSYLGPAMNERVNDILSSDNVTALNLWQELTATREGRQFVREIIRFLYSYDSTSAHEAVDRTIAHIETYTK